MRVPGGTILLTGILLGAGCGGSVVTGTADAGGGSGAVGGSGAAGAGASPANTGGSAPVVDGGPVTLEAGGSAGTTSGPGRCTDPADMAAYKASYALGDGAVGSVQDIAQACGLGCLSDADPNQCTLSCIEQRTNHAFSQGCAKCFVDSFVCGIQNCLTDCLTGTAQCNACLCANGCIAATVTCTGIPDNTCTSGG